MNNIFQSHDLFCGCNDPTLHFIIILNRNGKAIKPEKECKNIKCLITGETTDDDGPEDVLQDGELEKLFADDFPEDTTNGTEDDSG